MTTCGSTHTHPDIPTIVCALTYRAEDVVKALLGEPSQVSRHEQRWGRHGSVALHRSGAKRGLWFDHERGEGGNLLHLIARERRVPLGDAIAIAKHEFLGGLALPPAPLKPRRSPAPADDARARIGAALRIWSTSVPINGTLAEHYFAARRGLDIRSLELTHAVEKVGCGKVGSAWLIWQILGLVQALDLARWGVGLGAHATNSTDATQLRRMRLRWRPEESERERLEVLHDGGEVELVASAGEAPKPHPLEAMVGLQMREAHLDPLSLVSRSGERLCLHLSPCDIAGVLVEVARDLARVGRGAALRSDRARHRSRASRRGRAACVRRARCRWSGAACRWGRCRPRARLSQRKSEREKMPSCRSLFSQTGMCGVIFFSLTSQPRNLPVP